METGRDETHPNTDTPRPRIARRAILLSCAFLALVALVVVWTLSSADRSPDEGVRNTTLPEEQKDVSSNETDTASGAVTGSVAASAPPALASTSAAASKQGSKAPGAPAVASSSTGDTSATLTGGSLSLPGIALTKTTLYPRIDLYSAGWKTLVDQYGTDEWVSPAFMLDGTKEQRVVLACMGSTLGSGVNIWNRSTFDEYPQWMGMSIGWIDEYRPVIVPMNEPKGLYVVGVQPYLGMEIPQTQVIWRIRVQEKL